MSFGWIFYLASGFGFGFGFGGEVGLVSDYVEGYDSGGELVWFRLWSILTTWSRVA